MKGKYKEGKNKQETSADVERPWSTSEGTFGKFWLGSLKNHQQQLPPRAAAGTPGSEAARGGRQGLLCTQANSWCTKIQTGMKLATSSWLFFSLCQVHSVTKTDVNSTLETVWPLTWNWEAILTQRLRDNPDLRPRSLQALCCEQGAPSLTQPFGKQIQLPIKHVTVSKCSGFSAQHSHYSAVKVKGSDIWCENYILTRCHVCLKFLFITT